MPGASARSTFRGVHEVKKGTWSVRISAGGVTKYVGCFDDEMEAARAYDRAAVQHHKLPVLNFLSDGSLNPDRNKGVAGTQVCHGKEKSSRYKGVAWNGHKWSAYYSICRKQRHIGSFEDEVEAARAVDAAIKENNLNTPLNFPEEHGAAAPMAQVASAVLQFVTGGEAGEDDHDAAVAEGHCELGDVETKVTHDGVFEHLKQQAGDGGVQAGAEIDGQQEEQHNHHHVQPQAQQQQQQQQQNHHHQQQQQQESPPPPQHHHQQREQTPVGTTVVPDQQPPIKRARFSDDPPSACPSPTFITTATPAAGASAAHSTLSASVIIKQQTFCDQPAVHAVPSCILHQAAMDSATAAIGSISTSASAVAASAAWSARPASALTISEASNIDQPSVQSALSFGPHTATHESTATLEIKPEYVHADDDDDQLCVIISSPASKPSGGAPTASTVQPDAAAGTAGASAAVRSTEDALGQLKDVLVSARWVASGEDGDKLSRACALVYQRDGVRDDVKDFAERTLNNPHFTVDLNDAAARRKVVQLVLQTFNIV